MSKQATSFSLSLCMCVVQCRRTVCAAEQKEVGALAVRKAPLKLDASTTSEPCSSRNPLKAPAGSARPAKMSALSICQGVDALDWKRTVKDVYAKGWGISASNRSRDQVGHGSGPVRRGRPFPLLLHWKGRWLYGYGVRNGKDERRGPTSKVFA